MNKSREQKAKKNILSTVLKQIISMLCGIVIPRTMIGAFGSVAYGATTSITQFLSYISLLEGGIGRVARGAFYIPLAQKDEKRISGIYNAIKAFFNKIGILFIVYTLVIATIFYDIADIKELPRNYIFWLVIAISLSTVFNYLWGISNLTLLNADQKQYLTNAVITITNILNAFFVIVLVKMKIGILGVKLFSSFIFIIRPVFYSYYVKKTYKLRKEEKDVNALKQKWSGLGQHMAYFIHTNTDIILLTLFADLKYVAIYSVYHLVVFNIWNIASAFSGGMEAAFGEMIAKNENATLVKSYRYYKALLSTIAFILFSSAAVLIVPFIRLYTKGVADANYIQPVFAMILLMSEAINCLSLPCSSLPISANCLKQTRWGAYSEALVNIVVSSVLIFWNPLLGVAIGTFAATLLKAIYYMNYSSKKILKIRRRNVFFTFGITITAIAVVAIMGINIIEKVVINNFILWILYGAITFVSISIIGFGVLIFLFPKEIKVLVTKVLNIIKKAIKKYGKKQ